MRRLIMVFSILFPAAIASAQEIPFGTALPVILNYTLDATKVQSGQAISAAIAQDVPLPSGAKIRARSRVNGRVLQADVNSDGSSYIRLRFEHVRVKDRDIPVTTSLRALASPREVRYAQLPTHSPVRGETPANWTTIQVGGDAVYRGGGHVMHGDTIVGDAAYSDVLAELLPVPQPGCNNDSGHQRLALWVFSSTACGAYGFYDLDIAHAGNTDPMGEIVLRSKTNVDVEAGSGMLLIIVEASQLHP